MRNNKTIAQPVATAEEEFELLEYVNMRERERILNNRSFTKDFPCVSSCWRAHVRVPDSTETAAEILQTKRRKNFFARFFFCCSSSSLVAAREKTREIQERRREREKKKINLFHDAMQLRRCCAGGIKSEDLCDNLCICEVVFAPKCLNTSKSFVVRWKKCDNSLRSGWKLREIHHVVTAADDDEFREAGRGRLWDFIDFSTSRCSVTRLSFSLRIQLFLNWKLNFYWKIAHYCWKHSAMNTSTRIFITIWISIECTFFEWSISIIDKLTIFIFCGTSGRSFAVTDHVVVSLWKIDSKKSSTHEKKLALVN